MSSSTSVYRGVVIALITLYVLSFCITLVVAVSPPLYDGNPSTFDAWARAVTGYLAVKLPAGADNTQLDHQAQMGLVLCLVTPKVAAYLNEIWSQLSDWASMKTAMRSYYLSPAVENEYRVKLQRVKQTSDVSSYSEYFLGLLRALPSTTLDEATKVTFYINGLQATLAQGVIAKSPATLSAAIEAAKIVASFVGARTEYPARDLRTSPEQPKQSPGALGQHSKPAPKTAMYTVKKETVLSNARNVYSLVYGDQDDVALMASPDSMCSVSFISTAIAEWLGLVPEVGNFDTLYTLNGPLRLTHRVTLQLRMTSTQCWGVPLTLYLHDKIPWCDFILSTQDYHRMLKEGGQVLARQALKMRQLTTAEVDTAEKYHVLEDERIGVRACRKAEGMEKEHEVRPYTPPTITPSAAVEALSPAKLRKQKRVEETGSSPKSGAPTPPTAEMAHPTHYSVPVEILDDNEAWAQLFEWRKGSAPPRGMWGITDYYVNRMYKRTLPKVPPRYDPTLDREGIGGVT